jgi:protein ImuB
LGTAAEPIEPIRPAELVEVRRAFAEPIGAAETIARYTGKLVAELCEELEAKRARRAPARPAVPPRRQPPRRSASARPRRCAIKRLTRLLCDKDRDDRSRLRHRADDAAATLAEPLRAKQIISSLVEEPEPDVSDLIDILANRVGEQRLYRFAPVAERRARTLGPRIPGAGARHRRAGPDWPRPSRLLPRPEPIETMALLPDHPPVWIHLARRAPPRARGADGPERIFGEWWKREAERIAVRDYFRSRMMPANAVDLSRRRRRGCRHRLASLVPARDLRMRYAELQVTSHFSFLRGASDARSCSPGGRLGIEALGVVDRNSSPASSRA